MTIILSADLGTTKITALAVDMASGAVVARASAVNRAEQTSAGDKARGYSELGRPIQVAVRAEEAAYGGALIRYGDSAA